MNEELICFRRTETNANASGSHGQGSILRLDRCWLHGRSASLIQAPR
jgi:hypothetical protein